MDDLLYQIVSQVDFDNDELKVLNEYIEWRADDDECIG